MKIGIVGLGFVGGTVERWFQVMGGVQLFRYDKFKNVGSIGEVNQADIIFVAVPTPFTDRYDDSAVRKTLDNIADGKIVVIKSTILPGSTVFFQQQHSRKTILFNPEFLTEANAYKDFLSPCRQLVGYANEDGMTAAANVLSLLPPSKYSKVMPSTEAELVKYMSNTFLSTRVIFANQIYDICQAAGADYNLVRAAVGVDPRIGYSHFNVFDGGYRGYGGHCLPKDTRALIQYGKSLGASTELLDSLEKINDNLMSR
jgi:UDPglucose 6-dehydrogenase